MRARLALGKPLSGILLIGLAAAGCTTAPGQSTTASHSSALKPRSTKVTYNYTAKDRDCLKRAMYFESEHSDRDGYMAVGTVIMNRVTSAAYPDSICAVVAQKRQFAPGVMTRVVQDQAEPDLNAAADAILRGERYSPVRNAMFFHTEGLTFPYRNMHYVTVAGGNIFYEKRGADGALQTPPPLPGYEVAMNFVPVSNYAPVQSAAASQFPLPATVPVPKPAPFLHENKNLDAGVTSAIPLPRPAPALDDMSDRFDTSGIKS